MKLLGRLCDKWDRKGARGSIFVTVGKKAYQVKWAIDPNVGWEQWGAPNEILGETIWIMEEYWKQWESDGFARSGR